MDRRIQIERMPRPEIGEPWKTQKYKVFFEGEELGVWKDPECSAARKLLERGVAAREDILRTYRGDNPSLRGAIGWFADRRVVDDDRGLRYVKWKLFPVQTFASGAASDAPEVE